MRCAQDRRGAAQEKIEIFEYREHRQIGCDQSCDDVAILGPAIEIGANRVVGGLGPTEVVCEALAKAGNPIQTAPEEVTPGR